MIMMRDRIRHRHRNVLEFSTLSVASSGEQRAECGPAAG